MALLYLTSAGLGAMALVDGGTGRSTATIVTIVSLLLTAFFMAAALVPLRPWGWVVGAVAIAIGLAGCTMVLSAPLLFHWMKPRTKAAFGRPPL